jgi:hypothetical protein
MSARGVKGLPRKWSTPPGRHAGDGADADAVAIEAVSNTDAG